MIHWYPTCLLYKPIRWAGRVVVVLAPISLGSFTSLFVILFSTISGNIFYEGRDISKASTWPFLLLKMSSKKKNAIYGAQCLTKDHCQLLTIWIIHSGTEEKTSECSCGPVRSIGIYIASIISLIAKRQITLKCSGLNTIMASQVAQWLSIYLPI